MTFLKYPQVYKLGRTCVPDTDPFMLIGTFNKTVQHHINFEGIDKLKKRKTCWDVSVP